MCLFGKSSIAHVIIRNSNVRVDEVNKLIKSSIPGISVLLDDSPRVKDNNAIEKLELNFPTDFWWFFSRSSQSSEQYHGGPNSMENDAINEAISRNIESENGVSCEQHGSGLLNSNISSEVIVDNVKLRLCCMTSDDFCDGITPHRPGSPQSWVSYYATSVLSRIFSGLAITINNLMVDLTLYPLSVLDKTEYSISMQLQKLVFGSPRSDQRSTELDNNNEKNGLGLRKIVSVENFSLRCCRLRRIFDNKAQKLVSSSIILPITFKVNICMFGDRLVIDVEFRNKLLINGGPIQELLSKVQIISNRKEASDRPKSRRVEFFIQVTIPTLCCILFEFDPDARNDLIDHELINLMNIYDDYCSEIHNHVSLWELLMFLKCSQIW